MKIENEKKSVNAIHKLYSVTQGLYQSEKTKSSTDKEAENQEQQNENRESFLPFKLVIDINLCAKKDAPTGIYMGENNSKFKILRKNYIEKNISPNRKAVKEKILEIIKTDINKKRQEGFITISKKNYNYKIATGIKNEVIAKIYDENNDLMSHYANNMGWVDVQTKLEKRVYNEMGIVYRVAWDKTRKEQNLDINPINAQNKNINMKV